MNYFLSKLYTLKLTAKIWLIVSLLWISSSFNLYSQTIQTSPILPDLSGLAWIDGDTFLAVHDAKNPIENFKPRVSMIWLPDSLKGITSIPLSLDWPLPLGLSSDLESVARIPGKQSFLLVESGEGIYNGQQFRRVFLVEIRDQQLIMQSFTELPVSVKNIEGSAVVQIGDRLIFICAERAEGLRETNILFADLQLEPLKIGVFEYVNFKPDNFTGPKVRVVSAIETDENGQLYIASAFDSGDDNGPFESVIYRIGQVKHENNKVSLILFNKPQQLATITGFKVESLAIRELISGKLELFAGTDDENYGGTLRLISIKP